MIIEIEISTIEMGGPWNQEFLAKVKDFDIELQSHSSNRLINLVKCQCLVALAELNTIPDSVEFKVIHK
jgi:hypothetical protein